MHPCADDYEFITLTDPDEATALGWAPETRLVVRLFPEGVPPDLLADGAAALVRLPDGLRVVRRLSRVGTDWRPRSLDGGDALAGCSIEGLVVADY